MSHYKMLMNVKAMLMAVRSQHNVRTLKVLTHASVVKGIVETGKIAKVNEKFVIHVFLVHYGSSLDVCVCVAVGRRRCIAHLE